MTRSVTTIIIIALHPARCVSGITIICIAVPCTRVRRYIVVGVHVALACSIHWFAYLLVGILVGEFDVRLLGTLLKMIGNTLVSHLVHHYIAIGHTLDIKLANYVSLKIRWSGGWKGFVTMPSLDPWLAIVRVAIIHTCYSHPTIMYAVHVDVVLMADAILTHSVLLLLLVHPCHYFKMIHRRGSIAVVVVVVAAAVTSAS